MDAFDNIEFRSYDYDGFKDGLFDLARTEFSNWTDVLESNSGVMFIEWLAFIAANLAYMQNFHAKQCFVPTVTEAKNVTKLAKQFDYAIPNNEAASVDITISKEDESVFAADIIIPSATTLKTSGTTSLIFETTEDLTIPSGALSGVVSAKNWESKTETDTSDGSQDLQFKTSYGPYVEETMVVEVDDVGWVLVDNFLDSDSTSEHFRIEVDSDSLATVIFGDGVNGKIPTLDSNLEFFYKVGGGADGNVSPDTITIIDGTFYDTLANPISLVVTNEAAADGGVDREAIEVTKLRIPQSISSKEITIAESDFESNIVSVSGVARTSIQTVNDNPDIPENTIYAYILPTTADTLSDTLEAQIQAALNTTYPRPLTQSMYLIGPSFNTIEIDIRDLEYEPEDADGSGVLASATITIINNTFNAGDTVTVNGVDFLEGTDWDSGIDTDASALDLGTAIEASSDPLLQDISATVVDSVITLSARTTGEHGNAYTLTKTDGATSNFTLSAATFQNGEDSTVQALIRASIEEFFGRTNVDDEGVYTVGFGETVFRNRLIWLIQDIDGVKSFNLETPAADTELEVGEFPKYTLIFTTT